MIYFSVFIRTEYIFMETHVKKNLEKIGSLITQARERVLMTQSDLATSLGTSQSAVARMEKGEQNFTTEMITKLGRALDTDFFRFAGGRVNFKIEGERTLSGSIETKTSKNAAVGLLCASLLNKGKTVLKNMPRIEEVSRIIEVLQSIGVLVKWAGNDVEVVVPEKIDLSNIDTEAAEKTRSIIMFIGPLLHRFSQFHLPRAGGCTLGARTVRPHFFAMEKFGVTIDTEPGHYLVSRIKTLKNADVVLYEAGDTVTENALMAAALIPGKTTLQFASANYQVQDMCHFLEKLGVHVEGIGTTTLTVYGVAEINTTVEYALSEDPTDAMFFIAAAIVTNSELTITRAPIDFLALELYKLEKMGLKYKILKEYVGNNGFVRLVDLTLYPSKLVALEDKIHALPYPGINMDNLPFFAVIATQAKGQTLIHDWVYEKRAIYFTELERLGAETILADPHRIYINGPTPLKANDLVCPPALRPATIIMIGMLGAKGTSILRNVYNIKRGYDDVANRLNSLGAKVEVLHEL